MLLYIHVGVITTIQSCGWRIRFVIVLVISLDLITIRVPEYGNNIKIVTGYRYILWCLPPKIRNCDWGIFPELLPLHCLYVHIGTRNKTPKNIVNAKHRTKKTI